MEKNQPIRQKLGRRRRDIPRLFTQRDKQVAFNQAILKYIYESVCRLRMLHKNESLPALELMAINVLLRAATQGEKVAVETSLYSVIKRVNKSGAGRPSKDKDKPLISPSDFLPDASEFTEEVPDASEFTEEVAAAGGEDSTEEAAGGSETE